MQIPPGLPDPTKPVPGRPPTLPPLVPHVADNDASPTVALLHYEIARGDGSTTLADFDAKIPFPKAIPGGFDDAVKAAQWNQEFYGGWDDVTHRPTTITQAIGIQQDAAGNLRYGRMTSFHRLRVGPIFVDGKFFDDNARGMTAYPGGQAADGWRLIGIVGGSQVFDLRDGKPKTIVNHGPLTPQPPSGNDPSPPEDPTVPHPQH